MAYILQILILIGFVGALTIVIRKVPVLMKLPKHPEVVAPHQTIFQWLIHLKLSEYFIILANLLEKGLRKLRVIFLRIDNFFIQLIQKTREKSQVLTIRYEAWIKQLTTRKVHVRHEDEREKILPVRDLKAEEEALIKAIANDPKNVTGYKKLGNIYLEQKNYHDALEAFKQALKLNPADEDARRKIEDIFE